MGSNVKFPRQENDTRMAMKLTKACGLGGRNAPPCTQHKGNEITFERTWGSKSHGMSYRLTYTNFGLLQGVDQTFTQVSV